MNGKSVDMAEAYRDMAEAARHAQEWERARHFLAWAAWHEFNSRSSGQRSYFLAGVLAGVTLAYAVMVLPL